MLNPSVMAGACSGKYESYEQASPQQASPRKALNFAQDEDNKKSDDFLCLPIIDDLRLGESAIPASPTAMGLGGRGRCPVRAESCFGGEGG